MWPSGKRRAQMELYRHFQSNKVGPGTLRQKFLISTVRNSPSVFLPCWVVWCLIVLNLRGLSIFVYYIYSPYCNNSSFHSVFAVVAWWKKNPSWIHFDITIIQKTSYFITQRQAVMSISVNLSWGFSETTVSCSDSLLKMITNVLLDAQKFSANFQPS